VIVADTQSHRLSLFRLEDGTVSRLVQLPDACPDVEECDGGWVAVGLSTQTLLYASSDTGASAKGAPAGDPAATVTVVGSVEGGPAAVAWAPGLGWFIRTFGLATCLKDRGHVHVLASFDDVAMAAMTPARVAWMAAVARAAPTLPALTAAIEGVVTVPSPPTAPHGHVSAPCTEVVQASTSFPPQAPP
jgi:hypothetical protein